MAACQPHAYPDGEGPGHRRALRAQPVLQPQRGPDRLRAGERIETHDHGEPHRVHRTQRLAGRPGGAAPHAPVGQDGRGARSVRRHTDRDPVGRWAGARDRLHPRSGGRRRRSPAPGAAFRGSGRRAAGPGSGVGPLEPRAGSGVYRDPRSRARRAHQRLVDLPDALLAALGPQRLLPVGRRLWLPRSVAGHHGSAPCGPIAHTRASASLRGAPIPRGRRPALVASSRWTGRAHSLLRRLSLATVRYLPIRAGHRRYGRARRAAAVPGGPGAEPRRRGLLRSAPAFHGSRQSLRTLPALDQARPAFRPARPAIDGSR